MPFYDQGDVRIRYEETGAGFPLLVTPGGGLNSRVSTWATVVFNAMEAFTNDFHCIRRRCPRLDDDARGKPRSP